MNITLWHATKQQVLNYSSQFCADPRFNHYLRCSYEAFCDSSSHILSVNNDFLDSYDQEGTSAYPFIKYSLVFFKSTCALSTIPSLSESTVAFYDLLHPICTQLTSPLFRPYHGFAWFNQYLELATSELVSELSECLSPSLFDLFSDSLPFGLRIQRFYENSRDLSSLPRSNFQLFLEKTLSTCFGDLISTYPVSIYLLGHTIYTWHHRHFELLHRLQLHCNDLFGFSFSNITSISYSDKVSGDNHNFHRRSYVLTLSFDFVHQLRICYKPRPLDNDEFFSSLCNQLLSKHIDSQLTLPKVYNFGSYGFTEYIPSPDQPFSDNHASLRRDGIWLFILWLFGFTDCTFENFIFDGSQHVLIDFETAFTGFFSHLKTPLSSSSFSPRAFLALSSTRTTLLPRWDLSVDDRIDVDVSCFGNRQHSSVLNTPLWVNVNSDYMIYYSSLAHDFRSEPSVDLSDSFISPHIRSELVIEGFSHASTLLPTHYGSINDLIIANPSLGSRFIFRDTAAYARFLLDIVSPHSLSSLSNFLHSIDKLDRLILDHPSSEFVHWILPSEKLQLFNLDIPYFYTDIHAHELSCCFGLFKDFCSIFHSGISYTSLMMRTTSIIDLQPLLIESSLYSSFGNQVSQFRHSPFDSSHSFLLDDFLSIWRTTLESSYLEFSDVESPFLLSIHSGLTRKDVQIENLRPNFLSGTLGIYYAALVSLYLDVSSSPRLDLTNVRRIHDISVSSYHPFPSLNSSNCGLNDFAGYHYGLTLVSKLDDNYIQPVIPSLFDSLNNSSSDLLASDTLKSDLFSGLSGLLTASLSCNVEANESHLSMLLDLLLTFQTQDGSFLIQRSSSKTLPLGIAHGVHGILICLLHFYSFRPSTVLSSSIHRLIAAYNLSNLDFDHCFRNNFSWCSGLSGHLIVLSYLSQIFPDYSFDVSAKLSPLIDSLDFDQESDLYFCCGLSGIYASLLYISLKHKQGLPPSFFSWFEQLKMHIIRSYTSRFSHSKFNLMKPTLLDGFSIFPFLSSSSSTHTHLLESILLFKN